MSEMTHTHHGDGSDGGGGHPFDTTARAYEEPLNRLRFPALVAAAVGLVVLLIGLLAGENGRRHMFQSYLYAYLFWFGLSLGSLAVLMLQHQTGGSWGLSIRRIIEAGSRQLPLMAVLFIPVLLGINYIYPWAQETYHATGFKHFWLQRNGFILRAIVYFGVWMLLAALMNKWSRDEDRTGDPMVARRMQLLSGPGIVLYGLTLTGAAIDWVMSLDPDWYSTMYGLLFVVGQGLSTLAMSVLILSLLRDRAPLSGLLHVGIFHDLGNLIMAFTMLWAYLNFSQFLIIWSGNIAEETPYYVYRTSHGWKFVGLLLVLFHFAVPFLLLLWRRTKRTVTWLTAVAALILVMRLVDLKWLTGPSFERPLIHGSIDPNNLPRFDLRWIWLDLGAIAFLGGVWVFTFAWQLRRRAILPANDPRTAYALSVAHGGH